jgi:transcriptional regulator with XRE-family HTH domain
VPKAAPSQEICRRVALILKEEREARGLSMNRVAEMAGLSQQMVSYIERGLRNPTLDSVLRIAIAMRLDCVDLIRRAVKHVALPH